MLSLFYLVVCHACILSYPLLSLPIWPYPVLSHPIPYAILYTPILSNQFTLSNSSIQTTPRSARTMAPASSLLSPVKINSRWNATNTCYSHPLCSQHVLCVTKSTLTKISIPKVILYLPSILTCVGVCCDSSCETYARWATTCSRDGSWCRV